MNSNKKNKNSVNVLLKNYRNKKLNPGSPLWSYAYHLSRIHDGFLLRNDAYSGTEVKDKAMKRRARRAILWHLGRLKEIKRDNNFIY